MSEKDGFLDYSSSKQKLITTFAGGAELFSLHPTAFVTRQGRQFLEDNDRIQVPLLKHLILELCRVVQLGRVVKLLC